MAANTDPDETAPDHRQRLARLVQERRREIGLSVRAAAQASGVARNTWIGVEDAARKTADSNYAGVERALQWEPGSVDAILAGGEPRPKPLVAPSLADTAATAGPGEQAMIRIMRSNLPEQQKRAIVRMVLDESEQIERQLLKRVDDMIRIIEEQAPSNDG